MNNNEEEVAESSQKFELTEMEIVTVGDSNFILLKEDAEKSNNDGSNPLAPFLTLASESHINTNNESSEKAKASVTTPRIHITNKQVSPESSEKAKASVTTPRIHITNKQVSPKSKKSPNA